MNDFKSKLPDFQELSRFASKLFKDVKQSVDEIITDYKKKREPGACAPTTDNVTSKVPISTTASAPQESRVSPISSPASATPNPSENTSTPATPPFTSNLTIKQDTNPANAEEITANDNKK